MMMSSVCSPSRLAALAALTVFATSSMASAQDYQYEESDSTPRRRTRGGATSSMGAGASGMGTVGLGLNVSESLSSFISTALGGNGGGATVYVPINLATNFRLEPLFSVLTISDQEESFDDDGETEVIQETDTTLFGLGIGAFYMWQPGASTNLYGGGRLGFTYNEVENYTEDRRGTSVDTSTTTASRNIFSVGGVVGGEYFFTPYISLGGEVGLALSLAGDPEVDPSPNDNDDEDTTTTFATTSSVLLRFYFF